MTSRADYTKFCTMRVTEGECDIPYSALWQHRGLSVQSLYPFALFLLAFPYQKRGCPYYKGATGEPRLGCSFFSFKSGVQGFGFRVEGLRLERLT